ncbi:GntR family transcriptional regulator, arabinose operon transcriptional repressor [Pseudobutyrivibrio ruminis]|uniref:GntR family transcriptional regulator, arabinose operon transcriptional repressor n=1 Tax=Pseudobutyrivibrio ruminis TaxID=46206 RepID=A0A1H7EWD6_9FIRM|nr:GntR family transcriptional regulator [Pseudobutyrivibrio ruminis]SEK18118.1 GntR family transcriptional regulator, arabinose operon transcriptional repressor [Pseudobutyrivibrio ruminis]
MVNTKYELIIKNIKKAINSGKYGVDEKIASENELAAKYGVSRQTVRKAIGQLISEGYLYARHGSGTFVARPKTKRGHSKNIAVVSTYMSDYIFPRVIQGINQVLDENGYSILLKTTNNSRKGEAWCMEELLSKNIDGMIIEPSQSAISCQHQVLYEQMDAMGIPYVFIQGCYEAMMDRPYVMLDDVEGGKLITEHLLGLGHRQIAGIFKADDTQGILRHKGYVKALASAGVAYDPDLVVWYHTKDKTTKPMEGILRIFENGIPCHGVVCYNDEIAADVIKGLTNIGRNVPHDISVTGFDNSLLAHSKGITTIAHPQEELGKKAAQTLLGLIDGSISKKEAHILLEPKVIERKSCF